MKEEINCSLGLKPGIISDEVFNRELRLCDKLSAEKGGHCGWGVCKDCGVIPLLYKLNKGILIEDSSTLESTKKRHTNQ